MIFLSIVMKYNDYLRNSVTLLGFNQSNMTQQNYSVNQYLVTDLLSKVQIGEIAIPEI